VLSERIEQAEKQDADIVSARALADLPDLLAYSERHLANGGTALFPKGVTWQKELEMARTQWIFDVEVIESQTLPGAAILKIEGASRV
jgi:16S rRNA (guanine527-N7)-methyltransferase